MSRSVEDLRLSVALALRSSDRDAPIVGRQYGILATHSLQQSSQDKVWP